MIGCQSWTSGSDEENLDSETSASTSRACWKSGLGGGPGRSVLRQRSLFPSHVHTQQAPGAGPSSGPGSCSNPAICLCKGLPRLLSPALARPPRSLPRGGRPLDEGRRPS